MNNKSLFSWSTFWIKYGFSISILFFCFNQIVFAQQELKGLGFQDVPWGSSFEEFSSLKSYQGQKGNPTGSLAFPSSLDEYPVWNTANIILDGPEPFEGGNWSPELPIKFITAELDNKKSGFVFFDNKLLFGYSVLTNDEFKKAFDILSSKYKLLDSKTVVNNDDSDKRVNTIKYSVYNKDKDTLIYLTQRLVFEEDDGFTGYDYALIQMSKSFLKIARQEISSFNLAKQNESNEETQKENQKTENKINDLIK